MKKYLYFIITFIIVSPYYNVLAHETKNENIHEYNWQGPIIATIIIIIAIILNKKIFNKKNN